MEEGFVNGLERSAKIWSKKCNRIRKSITKHYPKYWMSPIMFTDGNHNLLKNSKGEVVAVFRVFDENNKLKYIVHVK